MKKIIACVLVAVLCLALPVYAEGKAPQILSEEAFLEKNHLYHEVIDLFDEKYDETTHGDFYFEENGDAVLNVVPEKFTLEMKADLEKCNAELRKNPLTANGIRIKEVKYTLAELKEIQNGIERYFEPREFYSIGIDTIHNKVEVCLPEELPGPRKAVTARIAPLDAVTVIYDDDKQFFTGEEPAKKDSALQNEIMPLTVAKEVRPGMKGYNAGPNSYCTFSWGVKRQGKLGYLYVAHGVSQGDNVFYDSVNIGKVTYTKLGSGVDCAFIERADSSKTISRKLPNNSFLTYNTPMREFEYKAGNPVKMYGSVSGLRSGTIVELNQTLSYPDGKTTITGAVTVSYTAQPGDSGAPVWRPDADGDRPIGIHAGMREDGVAAFVLLDRILSYAGMTLYDF